MQYFGQMQTTESAKRNRVEELKPQILFHFKENPLKGKLFFQSD